MMPLLEKLAEHCIRAPSKWRPFSCCVNILKYLYISFGQSCHRLQTIVNVLNIPRRASRRLSFSAFAINPGLVLLPFRKMEFDKLTIGASSPLPSLVSKFTPLPLCTIQEGQWHIQIPIGVCWSPTSSRRLPPSSRWSPP